MLWLKLELMNFHPLSNIFQCIDIHSLYILYLRKDNTNHQLVYIHNNMPNNYHYYLILHSYLYLVYILHQKINSTLHRIQYKLFYCLSKLSSQIHRLYKPEVFHQQKSRDSILNYTEYTPWFQYCLQHSFQRQYYMKQTFNKISNLMIINMLVCILSI